MGELSLVPGWSVRLKSWWCHWARLQSLNHPTENKPEVVKGPDWQPKPQKILSPWKHTSSLVLGLLGFTDFGILCAALSFKSSGHSKHIWIRLLFHLSSECELYRQCYIIGNSQMKRRNKMWKQQHLFVVLDTLPASQGSPQVQELAFQGPAETPSARTRQSICNMHIFNTFGISFHYFHSFIPGMWSNLLPS